MSLSASTITLMEPEARPLGCGLPGVVGLFPAAGFAGGGAALGAPFGKAEVTRPEIRAAMVKGWPVGTICAISSCGCGLTRICMASSSDALPEDFTSGVKVVLAPLSGESAPTLARLSDCRLAVT